MPESTLLPVRWLPCYGVNRWEDVTTLPPQVCLTALNFLCDQRTLRVREGIAATTFSSSLPGSVLGIIYACYSDGTPSRMFAVHQDASNRLYLTHNTGGATWTSVSWPDSQTVTAATDSEKSVNLIQYKDNVYVNSLALRPVMVSKGMAATWAGCPDPEFVKVLDWWESNADWSVSGTGGQTPATETNATMYTMGSGGVRLSATSPSQTVTFTWQPASAMDLTVYSDGSTPISGEDYICFYLHRFYRDSISSLVLRLGTSASDYWECPVARLVGTSDVEASVLSSCKDSIINRWSNDYRDFSTFFVRLRKSWFRAVGSISSWSAITRVSLVMTTTSQCSSTIPATIVVNDLHVRSSSPLPETNGIWLADFEGDEAWAIEGAGTGTRTYTHVTEGAWAYAITSSTSGVTAALTLSPGIDIARVGDGSLLTQGDRLVLDCTTVVSNALPGKITLTVTLTNEANKTVAFTYVPMGVMAAATASLSRQWVKSHTLACPFAFAQYNGVAGFDQFLSSSSVITKIQISAQHVNASSSVVVHCNGLRIIRGQYRKYIATFTPGIADILNESTEAFGDRLLSNYPIAAALVDRATDFIQNLKWRPEGQGWYKIPHYKHSEKGLTGFSSLLISAGGEGELSLWGTVAGLKSNIEGFRITCAFKQYEHKDLTRYIDLWSTFNDLYNYRASGTGSPPSTYVPISDHDEFRIWTWIDDPNALSQIKFRLYFTDISLSENFSNGWAIIRTDETATNHTTYVEYVWDASRLHNKEAAKYLREKALKETAEENQLRAFMTDTTYDLSKVSMDNAPDYLKAVQDAGRAPIDRTLKAASKLIPGIDKLWQGFTPQTLEAWGAESVFTGGRNEDGSVTHVIRWRRSEFVPKPSMDADIPWDQCVGFSIEVVPKPGQTVQVAFDNWYIHTKGALSGNYWYAYTFTDSTGEESAPSSLSPMVAADGQNVYLRNLPAYWPPEVQALNIYRTGGSQTTWNKVGQIGRRSTSQQQTTWVDTVPDSEVGMVMPQMFEAPPKSFVMRLSGDRMIYANVWDKFNRRRPSRVYISEPYYPGRCSVGMIRDFNPNDGDEITAHAYFAGYDVIFKNNSIWTMNAPDYIPVLRSGRLGCVAKRSVAVTDGGVLFLSSEGPAFFNIHEASSNIGLVVRPLFEQYPVSVLARAVGFVHDNFYWLFYGKNNEEALVLHIPTKIWTQAKFRVSASEIFARVSSVTKSKKTDQIWVGTLDNTSNGKYVFDFLKNGDGYTPIYTDIGNAITSLFETGRHDLETGEIQKNLKALYVRYAKLGTASATITITPVSEQTDQGSGASSPLPSLTAASTTPATRVMTPNVGNNGFTQGLAISGTGRYVISMLTAVYDRLPWRVR